MVTLACVVFLTIAGQETETFPFPTYREAVRFTEGIREGFDIPDEVTVKSRIECDPELERAWKTKKGKGKGRK